MKTTLSDRLQQLSPRERVLGGIALALTIVIGLSYGVLAPGLAAARSATDRSATAAQDLTTARAIAVSISNSPSASLAGTETLRQSAESNGLAVVSVGSDQGVTSIRVSGLGPAAILAWVSRATDLRTMRSVTIEPDADGATATITFAGPTQ